MNEQAIKWLSLAIFVVLLGASVAAWMTHAPPRLRPRSAEGPGGYLDHDYNQQLNLNQTGVNDVQIPLAVRQEHARKIGIAVPES